MQSTITLINTTRCNFRCKHCIREYHSKQYDTPLSVIKKGFKEASELGFRHVSITGGEPILHPKFQEIVDLTKKYELTWSFVTNGSFTEKYEKVIDTYKEDLKFVALSFDGGSEETHDFIRTKGSFNKVIEAVKYYKSKDLFVKSLYTVNSKNIEEIPKFIELGVYLKIDSLRFASINPTGFTNDLELSREQKIGVYGYINNIRLKMGINISHTNSLYAPTDAEEFCPMINDHGPTINPHGEYIFCCDTVSRGAVLGNLKKESFGKLYLKGLKQAAELKKERIRRIKGKELFKNFNSCYFCNFLLKEKIKEQRLFEKN